MSGMVESCYFNLEIFCSNGIIESLTNNRHNHNLLYNVHMLTAHETLVVQ